MPYGQITDLNLTLCYLEYGGQVDALYTDFGKAFDKAFDEVPHARLLSKLFSYGISKGITKWITGFFNRQKI